MLCIDRRNLVIRCISCYRKSMLIKEISFSEISEVWSLYLWPDRKSPIEPVSAITLQGSYDMSLMSSIPFFWGAFADPGSNNLIGVVSGFQTDETHFRSRGIWVHSEYRNQGLGSLLLGQVFKRAEDLKCDHVWTMPRVSAWPFYKKNGFRISSETNEFEFGPHYLAVKKIKGKNL